MIVLRGLHHFAPPVLEPVLDRRRGGGGTSHAADIHAARIARQDAAGLQLRKRRLAGIAARRPGACHVGMEHAPALFGGAWPDAVGVKLGPAGLVRIVRKAREINGHRAVGGLDIRAGPDFTQGEAIEGPSACGVGKLLAVRPRNHAGVEPGSVIGACALERGPERPLFRRRVIQVLCFGKPGERRRPLVHAVRRAVSTVRAPASSPRLVGGLFRRLLFGREPAHLLRKLLRRGIVHVGVERREIRLRLLRVRHRAPAVRYALAGVREDAGRRVRDHKGRQRRLKLLKSRCRAFGKIPPRIENLRPGRSEPRPDGRKRRHARGDETRATGDYARESHREDACVERLGHGRVGGDGIRPRHRGRVRHLLNLGRTRREPLGGRRREDEREAHEQRDRHGHRGVSALIVDKGAYSRPDGQAFGRTREAVRARLGTRARLCARPSTRHRALAVARQGVARATPTCRPNLNTRLEPIPHERPPPSLP